MNRDALRGHGQRDGRAVALDVVEDAIDAMHPDRLVPAHLERDGDVLRVDGTAYDLAAVDSLFLLAVGKGSLALARAVADALGDRLDDGVVVEKHGQGGTLADLAMFEAGHPLPNEDGATAARAVLDLADRAGDGDLVIACITGGTSALLPAPAGEVTLADLRETTDALLGAGAPVADVNAVRKHLSRLKGGRLAARIAPAQCLTLVVVDEVAGDPWGPTVPDATTYADALEALDRHGLSEAVPERVGAHLRRGRAGEEPETPAPNAFDYPARAVVLADAVALCDAAAAAVPDGYDAHVLSATVEGESREVARAFGALARECADRGRPFEPPAVLVSGGETTVTLGDEVGDGGPNQEFALSLACEIDGRNVCAVAVGTDGTDGPTDLAGGVVDGETLARAADRDVDVADALARHDAATALDALGDAVVTGPTGTNVMDLRVIVLGE
ncbi:MAG: glycerate kinase [Haloarculaceae archaeon]